MVKKFISLFQSTQKFLQDENYYLEAGKVQALLRLLKEYQAEGRRMLIFSQVGISSNRCLSKHSYLLCSLPKFWISCKPFLRCRRSSIYY